MRPKISFHRHIRYERKQLRVNRKAHYQSYAGTCYHSQQLAEKLLKQKLQEFGAENTYTHNLPTLVGDLAMLVGIDLGRKEYEKLRDSSIFLSRIYGVSRYPEESVNDESEITVEQAAWARECARYIESWVDTLHFPQDPREQAVIRQRLVQLGQNQRVRDEKRYNRYMMKILNGLQYNSDSNDP